MSLSLERDVNSYGAYRAFATVDGSLFSNHTDSALRPASNISTNERKRGDGGIVIHRGDIWGGHVTKARRSRDIAEDCRGAYGKTSYSEEDVSSFKILWDFARDLHWDVSFNKSQTDGAIWGLCGGRDDGETIIIVGVFLEVR
ncbi:hypothetical protein C8R46DRAFT_1209708 [Mycena filopes]|nr:hypothetical protein C8R46DRAFT_1209708 [Mycena filopes]